MIFISLSFITKDALQKKVKYEQLLSFCFYTPLPFPFSFNRNTRTKFFFCKSIIDLILHLEIRYVSHVHFFKNAKILVSYYTLLKTELGCVPGT